MAEIVGVTGLVIGVVGIIDRVAQKLTNIKKRCEDFKSLLDDWICLAKSIDDCETSVEHIKSLLVEVNDSIGGRATNVFCTILQDIQKALAAAEAILKNLEDEYTGDNPSATASGTHQGASSSSRQGHRFWLLKNRRVRDRPVNKTKLFLWVDKVKSALENLDAICEKNQLAILNVRIGLAVIIANQEMSSDKYVAHFDKPPLPNEVVLNFSGNTMEACLKHAALSGSGRESVTAVVSPIRLSAVGMGGVGKTVALMGLCHDADVQNKYFDGVFFVSLGQGAAEEVVIEGIAHFVESSGGKCLAKDITKKSSVDSAARQASIWFKDKCALFVCDDIWSFDGRPTGYLSSLKLLLCHSSSNAMVISTREKSVSQQFVEVKFGPRASRGEVATSILANYACVEVEASRASSDRWSAFGDILDVCGGLPVALGVAGTSLRNMIEENNGNIGRSLEIYAHELKENTKSVGDESVNDYPGLRAVIETSLSHCEKWAHRSEGRGQLRCELSITEKFEALSVLRKQGWIPRTCLKCLWGTNERATEQLMTKLSNMHLVSRRKQVTPAGEIDGLVLLDLVLDQANALSIENNREFIWHARLLDAYIPKSVCTTDLPNKYNCREWWDLEAVAKDGYIQKNLARHLAKSESHELESLLSDVRWSKRRMTVGGIVALRDDFRELSDNGGRDIGADAVLRALEESWMNINKSIHTTAFEMYGRLQSQCTSSEFVERFLSSVSEHVPKPYYLPGLELRWKFDTGQLLRVDFEDLIPDLCFVKQQNVIAVSQYDEIHVFDLEAMRAVRTLKGHDSFINSVDVGADGNRIVSGSADKTVRVWDGQNGECILGPLHGHESTVLCVAMSEDGNRIVSGSFDTTVRVWDGQNGECILGPFHGHENTVYCVAMSEDGNRIVSGSFDTTVRVWDGQNGECILGPLHGHENAVLCVAMSEDGNRIVSGSMDKTVRVWKIKIGEGVADPVRGRKSSGSSFAMSRDENWIVSGSDDATIRVWDGQNGECILGPLYGHENAVYCVAMSEDGNRIVSGSLDTTIRVWDGQNGECILGPLYGHENAVYCVAMSEDGNRIISGSMDTTVRVWDRQNGECILGPLHGHKKSALCAALSDDGNWIVSGCWDKSVRVLTGQNGACVQEPLLGHTRIVTSVSMSRDGSRIVSGSPDRTVRVWDGQSGECLLEPLRGHEDSVCCVAISGNGNRIISGSRDRSLRVWNGHNGECVLGPLVGHDDIVTCIAMSEDESRIVSESIDRTVRVWDGQSGECVMGPLRGHEGIVTCVALRGDKSRIFSGSQDKTVRVWHGTTVLLECSVVQYVGTITSLEVVADSYVCVVRTSDEDFNTDGKIGTDVQRFGYITYDKRGRIFTTGKNGIAVLIAIMPFECVTLCLSKLRSKAIACLADGQVVVGELVL